MAYRAKRFKIEVLSQFKQTPRGAEESQMTNYGNIVDSYMTYASDANPNDAELLLGRMPALAALGNLKGKTVLDFGCGPATNSQKLREGGARVIGLDIYDETLEQARKVDPVGDYRANRGLLSKELGGVCIDCILMSYSCCAAPDRELRYVLREMREMLKEGGKLVIIEPNLENALGIQYRTLHYLPKDDVRTGDVVTVMLGAGDKAFPVYDFYRRHNDYRALLEEAGFRIEQMREPVPERSWGDEWNMERAYPPFLLIEAR
jgi:SAM-dependent methyltransferase